MIRFLLPFCCAGNGAHFSIGFAKASPIKSGQVHISSPDLSLNNNPNNDFLAEALEALLNRIQVDIEVDSNLKGLKKGNVLSACGLHGSRQRKEEKKGNRMLVVKMSQH